jgi:predicted P-loop ATPase
MSDTSTALVDTPGPAPEFLRYLELGFKLVRYPHKQKGPTGVEAVDWPRKTITTPAGWVPNSNWGVLLGTEITPGKFLADIDFDWQEGLPLAKAILPRTLFGYGRESRAVTHAFYTTPAPLISKSFDDIDGRPLVELRATKADGSIGLQTMLPPSIHPSGEKLILRSSDTPGHEEGLYRRVVLYAIACLLFKHIGQRGLIHDARLAMAGYLIHAGLDEGEVILVGQAVAEATGNNTDDVITTVRSTLQRSKSGERVQGKGQLAKIIGDDGRRVCARITEWLGGGDFITDQQDRILSKNQENCRRALGKLGAELRYNAFTQKPELKYKEYNGPVNDSMLNTIWFDVDSEFHFQPPKEFFQDFVLDTAFRSQYHPVKDYLSSLKWDGVKRVDTWLSRYGGADENEYTRAVGAIVLIAAVRRVMDPGCKFDEMLVLESDQGLLKSTALAMLCPQEEWFSDNFSLTDDVKQVIENTAGKWIIEVAELSGVGQAGVEHLTATLSRRVDGPVRLAYARLATEVARQFILVGTTNNHAYLLDKTGNRRFWPCRVHKFDIEAIKRDRDQLWAEAAMREAAGESIRLHASLWQIAGLQQERRRAEDPWEPILRAAFPTDEALRVTPDKVWEVLGIPVATRDDRLNRRVIAIMQQLGFRRLAIKQHGVTVKGWARDMLEGQLELPNAKE